MELIVIIVNFNILLYNIWIPDDEKWKSEHNKIYFEKRRTTSHWAYPIKVNVLQPRTW